MYQLMRSLFFTSNQVQATALKDFEEKLKQNLNDI